ncbi:transposase [Streptomyces sp. TG1A-60]|uniref:transposase n=1 Tax=Streptomyces sp. TG1A-60 TaxID=3129111 RepID=UPI0030CD4D9C
MAGAAFPAGSLPIRLRDRLEAVFDDEPYTDAFGVRGAPGLSPAVLSLVTVLQFTEDLTDRQAAAMAVRAIDWKYAIGAELTDPGFDFSVLAKFRARLIEHGMERLVFDRLLEHCRAEGLVAAGGKQRSDSTHVISAVRDLNRLELAGESVRAALEVLAAAAPEWLAGAVDVAELAHRYGPRVDGWKLPASKTERDRLAVVFGQDALMLCRAVRVPGTPPWLAELPAVELLRQVLVQTYCIETGARGREVIRKREAETDGVPPGHIRGCAVGGQGRGAVLAGLQDSSDRNLQHSRRSRSRSRSREREREREARRGAAEPDHRRAHHESDGAGREGHRRHPAAPG